MKITSLKVQARNADRVNVYIDGAYALSLDMAQIVSLGVKVGAEYTEEEYENLKLEGQFGKLYARALEYALMRPRSMREMSDYFYRKTRPTRTKSGSLKEGYSRDVTQRVFERLQDKGYVDDEKFARYWIENRNVRKGISSRKLQAELFAKGVNSSLVQQIMGQGLRNEMDDLRKIIAKKVVKYDDPQKLIAYLARQGFSYDDIKQALQDEAEE